MKSNLASQLLVALYSAALFEGFGSPGKVLRQERPWCCGREIDLNTTIVCLRGIQIAGKAFTVLEPYCPSCRGRVPAVWNVVQ